MKESINSDWTPPPAPPPVGSELLEEPFPWFEMGLGVGAILVFLVLIWWVFSRSGKKALKELSPLELALQAIEVARNSEGAVLASELSLIVRTYLFSMTKDQAVYETAEEIAGRPERLQSLSDEFRDDLRQLLENLDQVRYRPQVETSEVLPKADEAKDLLEKIDRELQVGDLSS